MADQGVFGGVIFKADTATAALHYQATVTTLNEGGCSPPIEKQNHLFSVVDSFIYRQFKGTAKNALVTCL